MSARGGCGCFMCKASGGGGGGGSFHSPNSHLNFIFLNTLSVLDASPRVTRAGRRPSSHHHPKPCSCPRSGAALPSAPDCFYPSGLRSKLRGVFLDGAGGFALRPRGKPRRFVSPAFRRGAGEEGGRRAGCVAAGPWGSADPRPGPLVELARACVAVGPPHVRPPPCSLLSASPRVAPERPQETGEKKIRRGCSGTFTIVKTGSGGGQLPAWRRRGAELRLRDVGRRRRR